MDHQLPHQLQHQHHMPPIGGARRPNPPSSRGNSLLSSVGYPDEPSQTAPSDNNNNSNNNNPLKKNQPNENDSDPDDLVSDEEEVLPVDQTDPLTSSIEELESRLISTLDSFKLHPGTRTTSSQQDRSNIHDELRSLLAPALEIASHIGPSVARSHANFRLGGVDESVEEVYARLNSDILLPVMVEAAQSEIKASKRAAALTFFHSLYRECRNAGSYLDKHPGKNSGPTGNPSTPGPDATAGVLAIRRRNSRKLSREGELLRYWVEASLGCLVVGSFTSSPSEMAVSARGVIAASASVRPCFRYISSMISNADDAGASRLFNPVMQMVERVLIRLFFPVEEEEGYSENSGTGGGDAMRSTCVKFLETVVLCFSYTNKAQPGMSGTNPMQNKARRGFGNPNSLLEFSLDGLPTGHPTILREALEEIGEYAFTTLRGLCLMGGQVKIDTSMLPDTVLSHREHSEIGGASRIMDILKPAALAYLEAESSCVEEHPHGIRKWNRKNLEMSFRLSQKSYALTVNALAVTSTRRPGFFKESVTTLAQRVMDPPIYNSKSNSLSHTDTGLTTESSVIAITSQLQSTCLTLLRNPLSSTTGASQILLQSLHSAQMTLQANKALQVSQQTAALKTAGRAARNRAALYYQWDSSTDSRINNNQQPDPPRRAMSKRQRETDDALAKMRAAKLARGLGSGIQLPTDLVMAAELVICNLRNLAGVSRPGGQTPVRKLKVDLDYVVDAVLSNGRSLVSEDGRWYDGDGGSSWKLKSAKKEEGDLEYTLDQNMVSLVLNSQEGSIPTKKKSKLLEEKRELWKDQCQLSASDAFGRIVSKCCSFSKQQKSPRFLDLGNQITARLAWTLGSIQPASSSTFSSFTTTGGDHLLKDAYAMAIDSVENVKVEENDYLDLTSFVKEYPLVSSCLALEMTPSGSSIIQTNKNTTQQSSSNTTASTSTSLSIRILNEAFLQSQSTSSPNKYYSQALQLYLTALARAGMASNLKPNDNDKKRIASYLTTSLPQTLTTLPQLTKESLRLVGALCDLSSFPTAKSSNKSLAASAALHAAKTAAEKRAKEALLTLRDIAFQKNKPEVRAAAVDCATGIASGRIPSSGSIEKKALGLVVNVLFPKSKNLEDIVVQSAMRELREAATVASNHKLNPPSSEETEEAGKALLEHLKKPAELVMALCVRRTENIRDLILIASQSHAEALSKAIRANMPKFARAVSTKYGASNIALQVSDMVNTHEGEDISLLLAFLDCLSPADTGPPPSAELVAAYQTIQNQKLSPDGVPDPRYIIPVLSGVPRDRLMAGLSQFVKAENAVYNAALIRMSERLSRQALLFRDPDTASAADAPMMGMTACEQLVYLHHLDFSSSGLPQKRYLEAIRICLEDDEHFSDGIIMAALDHMSERFLQKLEGLPLAYMRTIILTCGKYESLHLWICQVLLPRLIEGGVYSDRRQWEGWMRCAKKLENEGREGEISSLDAISKLPQEQLRMYRAKYPKE